MANSKLRAGFQIVSATATRDVWIYDLARGLRNRLTFDPEDDLDAKWSPDGRTLAVVRFERRPDSGPGGYIEDEELELLDMRTQSIGAAGDRLEQHERFG